jgi:hypothetical protein
MYRSAAAALNDTTLPEHLVLSAHAFRELLEKLPAEDGVEDANPDLLARVKKLVPFWEKARAEKTAAQTWAGTITDLLRSFLEAAETFFATLDSHAGSRRTATARYLNTLDPSPAPLPPDVQTRNAKTWMDLRKFFNDVSHHKFPVDDAYFRERVAEFEAFLVARLNPKPTSDFTAIDALLREG